MYKLYQNTLMISRKSYCIKFYKDLPTTCGARRLFSNFGNTEKSPFVIYDDMMLSRRTQASKSLLVQVNSEKSYPELFSYCSKFGTIQDSFHYNISEDDSHFILIEFESVSGYEEALKNGQFNDENVGVPVRSQFMWFKAGPKIPAELKLIELKELVTIDGKKSINNKELKELLSATENIDDQITVLHKATCLSDLGVRLRFIAAKQIEQTMLSMFPEVQAIPFGSSVNGFGKINSDLDMILKLKPDYVELKTSSRLMHHTKSCLSNERSQVQREMECLGDILNLFSPGVSNVRRILQARVPIIKFNHEFLDLEVDLSMSNLTGSYMSELLYLFGEIDHRVRPLTFCIRKWAQAVGLTNSSPGRWISNFSLTMLVMFFLQQLHQPILPSIDRLIKNAAIQDLRITDDNINCTFQRDLNKLDFKTTNIDPLGRLLIQFFEFYAQFEFGNRGISLNESKSIVKPDHSAIYIVNPLEPMLNVSKNISLEEMERFKLEVKNAAWILDSFHLKTSEPNWGVLALFKSNQQTIIRPQMFFKPRMFEVTDLFDEKYTDEQSPITYKNISIKGQVEGIRKAGKQELNKLSRSNNISRSNSTSNVKVR